MAAKKQQSGRRTTIYRLTGLGDLRDAIRPKYLEHEHFRHESVEVGERAGFLITGAMVKDKVAWCFPPRCAHRICSRYRQQDPCRSTRAGREW